jgi:squid-like protein
VYNVILAGSQEYEIGTGEFPQDGVEQQLDDEMNGGGTEECGEGGAPAYRRSADVPDRDDDRKSFVGGLSWETTDKELREHFHTCGKI